LTARQPNKKTNDQSAGTSGAFYFAQIMVLWGNVFKLNKIFMKTVQEVFDRLAEIKKEQKNVKGAYKDALDNSDNYRKVVEDLKSLREKKKQIETMAKQELGDAYQKIEDLSLEMKGQKEMLSDAAVSSLMKGETVEVKDEYGNAYEPVWSVSFRKNISKSKPVEL